MPRGEIVRGETVENIVEFPEGWSPGPGLTIVTLGPTDNVSPGDKRKAGKFEKRSAIITPDPAVEMREDVDWLIAEVMKLGVKP